MTDNTAAAGVLTSSSGSPQALRLLKEKIKLKQQQKQQQQLQQQQQQHEQKQPFQRQQQLYKQHQLHQQQHQQQAISPTKPIISPIRKQQPFNHRKIKPSDLELDNDKIYDENKGLFTSFEKVVERDSRQDFYVAKVLQKQTKKLEELEYIRSNLDEKRRQDKEQQDRIKKDKEDKKIEWMKVKQKILEASSLNEIKSIDTKKSPRKNFDINVNIIDKHKPVYDKTPRKIQEKKTTSIVKSSSPQVSPKSSSSSPGIETEQVAYHTEEESQQQILKQQHEQEKNMLLQKQQHEQSLQRKQKRLLFQQQKHKEILEKQQELLKDKEKKKLEQRMNNLMKSNIKPVTKPPEKPVVVVKNIAQKPLNLKPSNLHRKVGMKKDMVKPLFTSEQYQEEERLISSTDIDTLNYGEQIDPFDPINNQSSESSFNINSWGEDGFASPIKEDHPTRSNQDDDDTDSKLGIYIDDDIHSNPSDLWNDNLIHKAMSGEDIDNNGTPIPYKSINVDEEHDAKYTVQESIEIAEMWSILNDETNLPTKSKLEKDSALSKVKADVSLVIDKALTSSNRIFDDILTRKEVTSLESPKLAKKIVDDAVDDIIDRLAYS